MQFAMTITLPPAARAALTTCALASAALLMAVPAGAQDTRAETIAAKQADKAKAAAAYQPSAFEKLFTKLEENFASPPSGFYPQIGTIPQGGGFSAGLGYRQFFARRAVFDLRGAYSVKNYQEYEAAIRSPWHGKGRVQYEVRAGYLDAPQVRYFGVGMEGLGRTNYYLKRTGGSGRIEFKPSWWTRLNGEVGYDQVETSSGEGSNPSIETIYTPADTPGMFSDLSFTRAQAMAAIDWRTSPSYSRKGGFYGATLEAFKDSDEFYTFEKLTAEVIQHLPILRQNWVLSFRGRMETVLNDDDNVPFYLLPMLGSGRTLRGYETGRFRDRHSILTSAEFRWIVNRLALDMAFFYDAGKVTNRREDLDFDGLKSDYGIGVRFHGPATTVLRLEGARGDQGWKRVVSTGAAW